MSSARGKDKKLKPEEFLQALKETVPRELLRRDESVARTREYLLQAHGRRSALPGEAPMPSRPPVLRWVIAGSFAIVALALVLTLTILLVTRESGLKLLVHSDSATLRRSGEASFTFSEGHAHLKEGDRVVTLEDGLASVHTDDLDRVRMDGSTTVVLEEHGENRVVFTLESGSTYHRVGGDSTHLVKNGEYEIEGRECVFAAHRDGNTFRVVVFEGSVAFRAGDSQKLVSEGEVAIADLADRDTPIDSKRHDPKELEDPWHEWNFEQDRIEGA